MDVERRIRLIRLIEKMEQNPEFSDKLGMINKSNLKPDKSQKLIT